MRQSQTYVVLVKLFWLWNTLTLFLCIQGASFGYHAGGWGKPPVDEHGRPLYGDVFGVLQTDMNLMDDEVVDSNLWGELESESEESEESEVNLIWADYVLD